MFKIVIILHNINFFFYCIVNQINGALLILRGFLMLKKKCHGTSKFSLLVESVIKKKPCYLHLSVCSSKFLFSQWIRYFCCLMRKMARWTAQSFTGELLVILRSCGRQSVAGEERFPFKALLILRNYFSREAGIYSLHVDNAFSVHRMTLFQNPVSLLSFAQHRQHPNSNETD